jgi:hypothetical protein
MDFHTFESRARALFAEVPEKFLEGIDGLDVSRRTEPHPTLPEIYTLGECLTEQYPSEFGGAGDVRSIVVLYYGSFLALSRLDDEWDWEAELYETLMHEVQHHLESLATEDVLEEIDFAEDQNFRRREGERFDPFFYRSGKRHGGSEWEVDGDFFVEVSLDPEADGSIDVAWRGESLRVDRPDPLGDVHFLTIEAWSEAGDVVAVLLPRKGWRGWLRSFLSRSPLEVLAGTVEG